MTSTSNTTSTSTTRASTTRTSTTRTSTVYAAGKTTCTHIEIRPGEGGDDAALFGEELAGTISSYATRHGAQLERSGTRNILLSIWRSDGAGDFELFSGIHRIQRIPTNDRAGRRHSSTVSVAVLDGDKEAFQEIKDDDVRADFYRGHGKGGQHRNKTSSAVRLTYIPSGVVVVVERGRSQSQNLESAWAELRRRLSSSHREETAERRNDARGLQIRTGERAMKQWTWNTQRGEVVNHESGQRWRLRDFLRGDIELEC